MSDPRSRFPESPMHPNDDYWHLVPEDSYSRELDSRVQAQERPYGYSWGEPPADTGDFNSQARVSKKDYPLRKGKAM